MVETEFRVNFFLWTIMNVLWGVMRVFIVSLIFIKFGNIAGCSQQEAVIVAIIHGLFLSILWMFVLPSLYEFSEMVRNGTLDFTLLRPVNRRFMVSARYIEFDQLLRILFFSVALFIFSKGIIGSFVILNVLSFLLVTFSGVVIFYNLFFSISTANIWFVGLTNLFSLYESIHEMGKFPTYVFQGASRTILFYILPIAFVATFPAQAILGRITLPTIGIGIVLAVGTTIFSQWFWNFALKHYSSASS